ncbi:MAG TPA: sulfatase-like hydrolase/transferase, partial [Anaerolineales bacterium]|nr:sulfatase-like hydrolase/transferase [Anaerolineales bacterium]
MRSQISRRDFLKLGGMMPLSLASPQLFKLLEPFSAAQTAEQNILVIVFDAFSGLNIPLNGYVRETTPNLARLASRAIVYHNHYAGSNFTTPGTASLLTGTLPWTHRALQAKNLVVPPFQKQNLFGVFDDHYRIGYSHNGWANILLEQARQGMDELVPWKSLFLGSYDSFLHSLFVNDSDIASVSWTRNVDLRQEGHAYSLMFSHLHRVLEESRDPALKERFPRGIPSTGDVGSQFLLETAVDWLGNRLTRLSRPFVGYFHFLPPHGPYNTSHEFYNRFRDDGLRPIAKPDDIFSEGRSYETLLERRTIYDEFILYVDHEFGRFYEALQSSGLLHNTWVVMTSDHGEMFERGISAHSTDALYEPVVRIPLMIFEPGREVGLDVRVPTSAADVLPTLAHVAGKPLPTWTDGRVLPPFAEIDPQRDVFVVRAAKNDPSAPLTRASTALIRGRYKLLYFFGYPEKGIQELVRLYDLESDPEEMTDLADSRRDVAQELLRELRARIAA